MVYYPVNICYQEQTSNLASKRSRNRNLSDETKIELIYCHVPVTIHVLISVEKFFVVFFLKNGRFVES